MKLYPFAFVTLFGLAVGAHAQIAAPAVTETTDATRAAAIERMAAELKARQEREAQQGRPQTSATVVKGQTDRGQAFMSGGNTLDDREAMTAERANFSLWVQTVAKGSGAYLSDAKLRIVDSKDKSVVVERVMDGPWFFIALPVGAYEVSATFKDEGAAKEQTLSNKLTIPKTGQRQAVLRFNAAAEVGSEAKK